MEAFETSEPDPTRRTGTRVGHFRYWFDSDRWEWSDEVAAIHGYAPGAVTPTTGLLASHKHPDDRETFERFAERMRRTRSSFSSRHRIVDANGTVRHVIVMARTFSEAGVVAGTDGFYIDVGDEIEATVRDRVADHVQRFRESNAIIEQVKGMLMAVYGIGEDRAFDVLRWLSQTRNVPVHEICRGIVASALSRSWVADDLRSEFDLVVLGGAETGAVRSDPTAG